MSGRNEYEEVFGVVSGIILNVTDNTGLKIEPAYAAKDIKNWDSLHHVMIINEVENYFDIQFDLVEMLDMSSVDDICHAVLKKKNAAE
jgi:acyl carrier protein